MRVAEIMNDYRNIHAFLAAIRASPTAEEYNEEGYLVLRRCVAEAQALLAQPFQALNTGRGDEEHDKMHLRRIIVDAAMRRFRAQKIYLAMGKFARGGITVPQAARRTRTCFATDPQRLPSGKSELASITDQRVEMSLRSTDSAAGKWLQEDPSLQHIQRMAGVVCGNGR
ncbi:hypothetical protein LTR82_008847 [Friedmanniomyces endolithicus]|uniref:Uncharacterized protein n=1 Tax=Friedmanniomyces endolithicus TaxID=329885 RepID=A0AAN6J8H6_9PEZI|nr:hypothetical protein LTR82_008847 [Friedmanniomyces endolithicus]